MQRSQEPSHGGGGPAPGLCPSTVLRLRCPGRQPLAAGAEDTGERLRSGTSLRSLPRKPPWGLRRVPRGQAHWGGVVTGVATGSTTKGNACLQTVH